jgi:hypothetical protein
MFHDCAGLALYAAPDGGESLTLHFSVTSFNWASPVWEDPTTGASDHQGSQSGGPFIGP